MAALYRCHMATVSALAIFHDEDAFGIQLGTRMQMMVKMMVALAVSQALELLLVDFSIDLPQLLAKTSRRPIEVVIIVYL